jgi:ketosteroid isomerase-like protein
MFMHHRHLGEHPLLPRCARLRNPAARGEGDAWAGRRGHGAKTGIRVIHGDRQGEAAVTEHPNVELTRQGYAAFAKGDLATLAGQLADDVTWHVLGTGPLSGTYHGRDEVFGFFGRLAEETAGTFRLDVHDVLANDEHAVTLCTLSASRGDKSIEIPVANVAHVRDGKVTEFWTATTDPQASIDFWS